MLAGVRANLLFRLVPIAVNANEKNVLAAELRGQVSEGLVIGVGVRTEARKKQHDDRAVIPLRPRKRELLFLHRARHEVWRNLTDLEPRGRTGEKEGCGGGPDEFDGYSAVASDVADFFAKLRITRFGEKPKLIPKARPGWIA